mgnify:CR=1 FL=1
MRLEWDLRKKKENLKRHGISFEEAAQLFLGASDPMEVFDWTHSDDEDRFVAIGPIARGVIVVVFTERDDETVRIISARASTRKEMQSYEAWKSGAID